METISNMHISSMLLQTDWLLCNGSQENMKPRRSLFVKFVGVLDLTATKAAKTGRFAAAGGAEEAPSVWSSPRPDIPKHRGVLRESWFSYLR